MNKLFIQLITLLFIVSVTIQGAKAQSGPDTTTLVYKVKIDKMIAAPLWRSVKKSFVDADSVNADFMLIHMNTYGGQVDIADSMRTLILNHNIPVLVFIDNQAISAGALIAISADSIYMRPGASIGAATVVDQAGTKMPDKYQSFMRGMMRATAEAHGKKPVVKDGDTTWVWHRDPEIAQAMVDPSIVLKGIVDTGQVLTLTTLEAIKYGFCEGEAETVEDVIAQAGIKNYTIRELKLSGADRIIMFLVNPVVSGLAYYADHRWHILRAAVARCGIPPGSCCSGGAALLCTAVS